MKVAASSLVYIMKKSKERSSMKMDATYDWQMIKHFAVLTKRNGLAHGLCQWQSIHNYAADFIGFQTYWIFKHKKNRLVLRIDRSSDGVHVLCLHFDYAEIKNVVPCISVCMCYILLCLHSVCFSKIIFFFVIRYHWLDSRNFRKHHTINYFK